MSRLALFALALLAVNLAAPARAIPVDSPLELVLAVDVSGTVDATEFAMQRDAYAAAFRDPVVQASIAASGGVAATLVYWAGDGVQVQAVPWAELADAASANAFADAIAAAPRAVGSNPDTAGLTGATQALDFSRSLFSNAPASQLENAFATPRRVIDISGDGTENLTLATSVVQLDISLDLPRFGQVGLALGLDLGWGAVLNARAAALAAGITINGLPIRPQVYDPPQNTNQVTETQDAMAVAAFLAQSITPLTGLGEDDFTPEEQAIVNAAFANAFLAFELGLLEPGQTGITLHEWFYRDYLTGGDGSFLVFADDFDVVGAATRAKLLAEIPEPASARLLGCAIVGLAALRRARGRRAA